MIRPRIQPFPISDRAEDCLLFGVAMVALLSLCTCVNALAIYAWIAGASFFENGAVP